MGVWNIHCPQVEFAEHAAEIVAASRYAPQGLRGNGGLSAATNFETRGTVAERRAFANQQVFITVMLETGAAFRISMPSRRWTASMRSLSVRRISVRISACSARPEQARVIDEKRDLILAAARKHKKTCAMLCASAAEVKKWKDAGALLLAYSSDVDVLHSGFSRAMKDLRG